MDYFQGVVTEYLRADRSMFVNTECLLQLYPGNVPAKGAHWICDAVAVNFRESSVYLCEVTYSSTMQSLVTRLRAWEAKWPALCLAFARDCSIPSTWNIRPWLFIPEKNKDALRMKLAEFVKPGEVPGNMPQPLVTYLESVVPWKYPSWDRKKADIESAPEPKHGLN